MALRKQYTKEEIETAVKNSNCYSEVFRQLGIKVNGGSYTWIKSLIKKFEIETNFPERNINFLNQGVIANENKARTLYENVSDISKTGYRVPAKKLKTFLLFHGRPEKCEVCGLDSWNDARIRLDIHHLDGNCYNNHLDNLQFICPNCHRQETIQYKPSAVFSRREKKMPSIRKRNKERVTHYCIDCGVEKKKPAPRCKSCSQIHKANFKIIWPSNEELKQLVIEFPLTQLSKKLGVSDNAIRKHCETRGIPMLRQTKMVPLLGYDPRT